MRLILSIHTQVDPLVGVCAEALFGRSDGVTDGQGDAETQVGRRLTRALRAQYPSRLVTFHHGHVHHFRDVVSSGRLVVLPENKGFLNFKLGAWYQF